VGGCLRKHSAYVCSGKCLSMLKSRRTHKTDKRFRCGSSEVLRLKYDLSRFIYFYIYKVP
jgi:hypothetical protein